MENIKEVITPLLNSLVCIVDISYLRFQDQINQKYSFPEKSIIP